ncbi:MAG: glutamine--tRNA ligase/YqeY domain fusion protein [Oscillospiraceae bacterium]|jgi:glutaminyl-tRNA synthetase|nr:glutamine--tRNA ligase/YqeY domain fusion protein [Oscillospiraceae bacterium]
MPTEETNINGLTSNFITDFIDEDLANGVNTRVQTRFPPEPNGYLHIGHAKAIAIDFMTARQYGGVCNLRMDDTNPAKEDEEYVDAIQEDIRWLGFEWNEMYYASGYFDFLFACALKLIKNGKAYVDELSAEEIREYRGTLTEPGKDSPWRGRSAEENLDLFLRMEKGEFPDGSKVLRAKIDMSSPNMNMRDPVIYRIAHITHHQTGDRWCIYPMYDFAHPLSDAAEKVTYSLCSLEFENHRPLYDWFVHEIGFEEPPRQIEFARLNLNYCVTSKRKNLQMVREGIVSGWDDPRMITLCGMRRRGYPPEAILDFVGKVGVAKAYSVVDYGLLEACVRDCLNDTAPRAMAVLRPLKVLIENYPEGQTEEIEVEIHPNNPEFGTRSVVFSREIYVERDDFMLVPPRKYFRLYPDSEVRLKGAYYIKCTGYDTDADGNVTCLRALYDPESRGGSSPDGRKVRGTLHWVSAADSVPMTVRLYDRLFSVENPDTGDTFLENLNANSIQVLEGCLLEGRLRDVKSGDTFQLMRQGYFCVDKDSRPGAIVLNRTVALNSSW